MRDPYLFDNVDVLVNFAGIKDSNLLRQAEADITNLAMTALYVKQYDNFDLNVLLDIHRSIFGQIYEWAGEFRSIQMVKAEDVLGGDTVRYTYPKDIRRETVAVLKEITKLTRNGSNDKDIVFRLVRIIAKLWQIHPFREGNTRCVIVFAVLLAKSLGYDVNHELFKTHASYVRNALVWGAQGIYSKYEYLERIFFDAILHEQITSDSGTSSQESKYEKIGDYQVKDYQERPHEYSEN